MIIKSDEPVGAGEEQGDPQSLRDLPDLYPDLASNLPNYLTPEDIAGIDGLPDPVYAQAAEMVKQPAPGGGASSVQSAAGAPQDASGKAGESPGSIVGKIWNAPNTAVGLGYGALGYLAGWPSKWLGLQEDPPGITTGNNAVQFTHSPFMAPGAGITLGNAQVFAGEPSDRAKANTPTIGQHEEQHTYQGQQLGPLYLPSNILGGIAGLLIDGSWHGPHNWNEVGPQQNPPVPWPKRDP
jgi:hypothetical protein